MPRVVAALLAVPTVLVALAGPAWAAKGEWLAGDLHVHTTYSHDSYGGPTDDNTGPEDVNTLGYPVTGDFALARSRGLDYLAITDHEDVRSQSDPGFGFGGVIPVPGYENSLDGHAQMLGATRLYDNGDESTAAVQSLVDALRADGGVFQVNHPSDPVWGYGYDVRPDTVEVWNLPRFYQPPFPSSSDNDAAVRYWEGWLDRGERVTATGGSDSHWVATSPGQGPGQPTTWVFARERTAEAVLEGLREGHTFISHQPPGYGGPKLLLEGPGRSIAGDTVPSKATLHARVEGAPGAFLRIVSDVQKDRAPVPVTSPSFEHAFKAPAGASWVRAELYGEDLREQRREACEEEFGGDTTYCRNRILLLAMTSAMYLRR